MLCEVKKWCYFQVNYKKYEANMRLTYAVRSIGKGLKAPQTFCAVMNHPTPPTKFSLYQKILLQGLEFLASKSMKDAVKEAVNIDGSKDLTAEFNPSWQKLGHTSLNCVVTATAINSGV